LLSPLKEGSMETVFERVAGLDVHKAQVTACVRVPVADGSREQQLAEFQTTVRGLMGLRDWLEAHRVTHVAMEATGVYWQPVWHVLEDTFELMLVNARHVKQVPGRKTDVSDAAWICQLMEAGLLRGSFVPPKPQQALRTLTRYRKTQIQERQREANRLHKALEDTGIKLDCVATDILGVSGRAMLDALVAGTTDPLVLAELARGRLRKKIPALQEALEGRFEAHHALVIGAILAHLDFLDEQIDRLSDAIEEQIAPFAAAVELLCTIPGVQRRAAEVIISEIGADMSVFPTDKHLASWAGQCPGNDQSAGKRRSGKSRKGSKWLRGTLTECSKAIVRTKGTYLSARYHRIKSRRGRGHEPDKRLSAAGTLRWLVRSVVSPAGRQGPGPNRRLDRRRGLLDRGCPVSAVSPLGATGCLMPRTVGASRMPIASILILPCCHWSMPRTKHPTGRSRTQKFVMPSFALKSETLPITRACVRDGSPATSCA
jgi:transposase